MHSTVGIFENHAAAEQTRERLIALGFERENVSLLTPDTNGGRAVSVKTTDTEERGTGAAIGGVVGAAAGASAGAALAAFIPGVGPVIAAGWAAMALLGVAGAVGGVVVGSTIEDALSSGLPKDELFLYEDALRQGHSIVIALSDDTIQIDAARRVIREQGAEDLDTARERWWIGVRPEDEQYHEPAYRHGVEAALHPDVRGKTWQQAEPFLLKRHGDIFRDEIFRRGYEHGRAHHERSQETHRQ